MDLGESELVDDTEAVIDQHGNAGIECIRHLDLLDDNGMHVQDGPNVLLLDEDGCEIVREDEHEIVEALPGTIESEDVNFAIDEIPEENDPIDSKTEEPIEPALVEDQPSDSSADFEDDAEDTHGHCLDAPIESQNEKVEIETEMEKHMPEQSIDEPLTMEDLDHPNMTGHEESFAIIDLLNRSVTKVVQTEELPDVEDTADSQKVEEREVQTELSMFEEQKNENAEQSFAYSHYSPRHVSPPRNSTFEYSSGYSGEYSPPRTRRVPALPSAGFLDWYKKWKESQVIKSSSFSASLPIENRILRNSNGPIAVSSLKTDQILEKYRRSTREELDRLRKIYLGSSN
jgi:hypothetical protein